MTERMIQLLEDALVEIDSLLSIVETYGKEVKIHTYISQLATHGSLLDGGRSIRIGPEGPDLGMKEGIYNVYDVIAAMYNESHTDS
jgi:hypothetical protein